MKRSLFLLAIILIFPIFGCDKAENAAEKPKRGPNFGKYDMGLKELGKKDIVIGKGNGFYPAETAEVGDQVVVTYTGKFKDETVFDSNDKPDANPYVFYLGRSQVIKGWDEGLVGMKVGGVRKLDVPWKMAYGEAETETIPGRSDLFFEVKLLDLIKHKDMDVVDHIDVKKGAGPVVAAGDKVLVLYEMKLANDKVLDSQKEKPVEWDVETLNVQGLKYGIKGMQKGGVRKIRIPPVVGYNTEEVQNQIVYVEVQVVDVMKGKGTPTAANR